MVYITITGSWSSAVYAEGSAKTVDKRYAITCQKRWISLAVLLSHIIYNIYIRNIYIYILRN